MTTKKATPVKAVVKVKKPALPKFGEIGFKFKIDAEIIEIDESEIGDPSGAPYLVKVSLGEGVYSWLFNEDDLKAEIAKYDPKAKKAAHVEKIKQTEKLLADLKKELESM